MASTVAICADLVDPGRVNILERWELQAALESFRSSGPDTEQRRAMLTVSVQEYDSADVRAVFRGRCGMNRRTDSAATDEIGAAVRWNRTTTNSARRELRP